MAHETAILEFGSSKITVLIGERGVNETVRVKGMGVCEYAGFMDGEWLDPEHLTHAVARAISSAESGSGVKITSLYIGVPGEFTSVVCKEVNSLLPKRRKVNDDDVFALYDAGDDFDNSAFEVIGVQPVYFTLDNDRRVLQPVGVASSKLGGLLSYIIAESGFTHFVRAIINGIGIESVEFVSSVLAEALLLFTEEDRDNTSVLIDVGYITSSVAVIRGDGILFLGSFSMGGGNIAADLTDALGISFTDAESLKRKTVLSIAASETDVYEINGKDGYKSLSAQLVNEIVSHRVQLIARAVEKCLSFCEYEYPDYIPYSLTGGGICYLRGAKDVMSKHLGRNVEIVSPNMPQVNRPNLSSSWGLLDLAIKNEAPVKKSLFSRLFKK